MKKGGVPLSPDTFPEGGRWDLPEEERINRDIANRIQRDGFIGASSMPFDISPQKKDPIKPVYYDWPRIFQVAQGDDDPLSPTED